MRRLHCELLSTVSQPVARAKDALSSIAYPNVKRAPPIPIPSILRTEWCLFSVRIFPITCRASSLAFENCVPIHDDGWHRQ